MALARPARSALAGSLIGQDEVGIADEGLQIAGWSDNWVSRNLHGEALDGEVVETRDNIEIANRDFSSQEVAERRRDIEVKANELIWEELRMR